MSKLYHGSYMKVDLPDVSAGRSNLDFGKGFYVTNLKEQAERWAVITGSRHNDDDWGIVNEYDFNDEVLSAYRVLSFPTYDIEWLDFVVRNRRGEENTEGYDAIEGGVANDQVIDTIEDYENGRITADQALDQLRFKKPNHQLCIRNQKLIDLHLSFCNSYIVKDME